MNVLADIKVLGLGVDEGQFILAIIGGIVTVAVWIASQIYRLGKLSQRIKSLEGAVSDDIKPELKEISKRLYELNLTIVGGQVTKSNSPRILNDAGNKILKESGIDKILDSKFEQIVELVRSANPSNSYQGEMCTIDAVRQIILKDAAIKANLEQKAYESGSSLPLLMIVGGVYIRDRVLKELGLRPEDIDKHAPKSE